MIWPQREDQKLKFSDKIRTLVVDEQTTQIMKARTHLKEPVLIKIENFLKANMDMMAYRMDEIPGVDLDTMVYCLNVQAKLAS